MALLLIYVSVAVFISFLCSILEAVILSITPSYLFTLKSKNPKVHTRLAPLIESLDRPLAAILTLNTISHTIGAAVAGAQVQKVYGDELLTLFSVILTVVILVFSEILPKSIGARFWRPLSAFAARALPPMVKLTLPLVWFTEGLSKFLKGGDQDIISREEVDAIAQLALAHGSLEKSEYAFLKRLMRFKHIRAADIMTPLEEVYCLPKFTTVKEAMGHDDDYPYSRIPVYGVNKDDMKGYVLRSHLLKAQSLGQNEEKVTEFLNPMLIISHRTIVRQIMFRLIERREHISGVINDRGDFLGIVTLEDIIEALIGLNIEDEKD